MDSFRDAIPGLLPGFLAGLVGQFPARPAAPFKVQVSIPLAHPEAEKLRKLGKALVSRQHLASGIEVKCLAKPGAVDTFLDALRGVGVDVDEIKDRLRPTSFDSMLPPPETLIQLARHVVKEK